MGLVVFFKTFLLLLNIYVVETKNPVALTYVTRGVSHCRLAIYIKKYLKAKEE
jgi:hypothetical protein